MEPHSTTSIVIAQNRVFNTLWAVKPACKTAASEWNVPSRQATVFRRLQETVPINTVVWHFFQGEPRIPTMQLAMMSSKDIPLT